MAEKPAKNFKSVELERAVAVANAVVKIVGNSLRENGSMPALENEATLAIPNCTFTTKSVFGGDVNVVFGTLDVAQYPDADHPYAIDLSPNEFDEFQTARGDFLI